MKPLKKALIVLMIDDFTNIHKKRRPSDQTTSAARNVATILMKRFCDGSAIPIRQDTITPGGICQELLLQFSAKMLPSLSATFAMSIPYYIRTAFFDPDMERSRIEIHDYQEQHTGLHAMRRMNGCKLIDVLEIPLKVLTISRELHAMQLTKALAPTYLLLHAHYQETGRCRFT